MSRLQILLTGPDTEDEEKGQQDPGDRDSTQHGGMLAR